MKLFAAALVAVALVGGGAGFWFLQGNHTHASPYRTAPVERGTLLVTVSATGTVQAENVIDVGAQNSVPLQIKSFGHDAVRFPTQADKVIDFNSPVKKDQVLAQLDTAIYQSQKDQAEADVANATYALKKLEADLIQQRAKLKQAAADWDRAQRVKNVISASEYDALHAANDSAQALVEAGQAALDQAKKTLERSQAALKQAETNLSYTSIRSPVDGIVIDRRVNVGQTVVSGLTASSLFLIAEDLKRLEVWASVNEADVGAIRTGQKVRFTVDSFPNESFYGIVKEIRLNAQMTQNVVTYPVVVTVDNSSGRLLPYMTANLQFEVSQRDNVLMVPNGALRWRPQIPHVAPDAREAYAKALQHRPGFKKSADAPEKKRVPEATVWVADGEFVRPVRVKIGPTDGNATELVEVVSGTLEEGGEVVIGAAAANGDSPAGNPFLPQVQRTKQ